MKIEFSWEHQGNKMREAKSLAFWKLAKHGCCFLTGVGLFSLKAEVNGNICMAMSQTTGYAAISPAIKTPLCVCPAAQKQFASWPGASSQLNCLLPAGSGSTWSPCLTLHLIWNFENPPADIWVRTSSLRGLPVPCAWTGHLQCSAAEQKRFCCFRFTENVLWNRASSSISLSVGKERA